MSLDINFKTLSKNLNPKRVLADGSHLPFHSGSFGTILCENVFEHLATPELVLRESHRVLKTDGSLVFLCPNRFSYIALLGRVTPYRFHVWFRTLLSATADEDTFPTYYRLNSAHQILALAARCGFRNEVLDTLVGWPTYWEFSDLLHRCGVVAHWLLERGPRVFHVTLVGVLRKQAGDIEC